MKEPTRLTESKTAPNGTQYASSFASHKNIGIRAEVQKNCQLPGLVIFVHGVNSQGEWYDYMEKNLCEGLNCRLGLTGEDNILAPNEYNDDNEFPIEIKTIRRSPVIRFYWGYRAKPGTEDKYTIPLRNKKGDSYWDLAPEQRKKSKDEWFWGGGPFQNGCTALYSLWSKKGFSKWLRHLPIPFSTQLINEESDRLLANAPPREYYAHAADRLAKLIKKVRELSKGKDTVTVVSHSQGTMIALAATAMEAPDALFVLNSPYSMDSKLMDYVAYPLDECVSSQARQATFADIVRKVAGNKERLNNAGPQGLVCGVDSVGESWHPTGTLPNGIKERDNHGRTYIYCSPHDRVMGSSPLLGIGWQGLPNTPESNYNIPHPLFTQVPANTLYVRMLARNTLCGGNPNPQTPFGTLSDMIDTTKEFWDSNESFFSKQAWPNPPRLQRMNINAEAVPVPVTAQQLANFDLDRKKLSDLPVDMEENNVSGSKWGYGYGQLDPVTKKPNDSTYTYYIKLFGYNERRVSQIPRVPSAIPSPQNGDSRQYDRETVEQMEDRLYHYILRPADHSDLPQHELFAKQVLTYDLPIGYCTIGQRAALMDELRALADWTSGSDPYFISGEPNPPARPGIIRNEIDPDAEQQMAEALAESAKENQALRDNQGI